MRKLNIHLVGLKGVPATFGGVEHAVEEIGARLAERGHRVVVHCRSHYTAAGTAEHRGMRLVREGSLHTKRLDTATHTLVAMLAAVRARPRPDVIGLHNYPNGPLALIGRAAGIPTVLHLHGFEWGLGKWNGLDKRILRAMLGPATAAPHALTSVSRTQAAFVLGATRRRVLHIPNGVTAPAWLESGAGPIPALDGTGLARDGYVLCVSRLVPQKGVEHLIRAYRGSRLSLPLAVVGDHNHAPEYAAMLRREADGDPRILFLGYRFGDELWSLYAGCRLFVLPSESEGMPLVLLEAMAARCAILASRLPEIEDVGGESLAYFCARDPEEMRRRLEELLQAPARLRAMGEAAGRLARSHHDWDRIADAYETLYLGIAMDKGVDRLDRRGYPPRVTMDADPEGRARA